MNGRSVSSQIELALDLSKVSSGATNLQMLDLSQDKTRVTYSHHTTESDFLTNLCLKTPIAWGNSVDERWTQLDDKVSDKRHICAALDAANIFGH